MNENKEIKVKNNIKKIHKKIEAQAKKKNGFKTCNAVSEACSEMFHKIIRKKLVIQHFFSRVWIYNLKFSKWKRILLCVIFQNRFSVENVGAAVSLTCAL